MRNFKHLAKVLACLLCCVACVLCVNPASAFTNENTVAPVADLAAPASKGHLVSYVRYSASASSTIIGCMENGTQLKVLGTKGNFYKIDCYDMVGYIAKSQVQKNEDGTYVVRVNEKSSETTCLGSFTAQQTMELRSQVVKTSKKYIGVPYVWGGSTPKGFDCSGYTQYVFRAAGITINRTACAQLANTVIVSKEDLQPGDLVIFSNTGGNGFASHTGIYLGNGKLIHSGASKGVVIVDLDSSYFAKHFQCARRVILTDVSLSASMPTVGTITGDLGSGWRNEG